MKLTKTLALFAALGLSVSAMAQQTVISPVPQNVEWGGKAFNSGTSTYKLTGKPDAASRQLLQSGKLKGFTDGKNGNVNLIVGKKGDKAVSNVANLIPDHPEGYYLKVEPGKVIVAGADDSGVYYGLQTLIQVASMPEVMEVAVTDYPQMSLRGVIEGFYGNPWSYDDRVSQFDFYGANKMNVYVYGPKDDPYHHSRWFEPYPEADAAKLSQLIKRAKDNKVKFVWAMHPSNSIVSDEDRAKALNKFEQMYDLGVRSFAIFFDDISAESVDSQISYVNFLTDEFVNKKGDVEPLTVCPTQYNKAWTSGDYLKKMGKGLYDGINIMWTGNTVVDMIQKPDCEWFESETGRKPFIWLNYPVNDYGRHHLLMGPTVDNGTDINESVVAFCSNPMQYAEASKVSLYSIADFVWNPEAYDAQQDWERSMTVLMPENSEAFRQFCIDNIDLGDNVHHLRFKTESPEFQAIQKENGDLTATNAPAYAAYYQKMLSAAQELLGLENNRLTAEIREFLAYYLLQAQRGLMTIEMAKALESGNEKAFNEAFSNYAIETAVGETIVSRDFEGSIQPVNAVTGTLYIEPFIKKSVQKLVNKKKHQ